MARQQAGDQVVGRLSPGLPACGVQVLEELGDPIAGLERDDDLTVAERPLGRGQLDVQVLTDLRSKALGDPGPEGLEVGIALAPGDQVQPLPQGQR